MIKYAVVGASPATAAIAAQLAARGAVATPVDEADVVLAAASTVDDATTALEALGDKARSTILVGSLPQVHVTRMPAPSTVEGMLETYRPLGILRSDPEVGWRSSNAGFIGTKALVRGGGRGRARDADRGGRVLTGAARSGPRGRAYVRG